MLPKSYLDGCSSKAPHPTHLLASRWWTSVSSDHPSTTLGYAPLRRTKQMPLKKKHIRYVNGRVLVLLFKVSLGIFKDLINY